MNFFDVLQLLGGVILALGYIPQIKQIIKTRSCDDLNFNTYLFMALGIGLMEIYAISLVCNGTGHMFAVTNTVSFFLVVTICILIQVVRCIVPKKKIIERTETGSVTNVKDALFVSKWSDDSVFASNCKVNMETKQITDIQSIDYDPGCSLREEVVIVDGAEYPAVELTEGFWYD